MENACKGGVQPSQQGLRYELFFWLLDLHSNHASQKECTKQNPSLRLVLNFYSKFCCSLGQLKAASVSTFLDWNISFNQNQNDVLNFMQMIN